MPAAALLGNAGAKPSSVYSVMIDVGSGEAEEVKVDSEKGPLVVQWDGSHTYYNMSENQNTNTVGPRDVRDVCRPWIEKTITDQKIILDMVARKNRKLRDWLESTPQGKIDPMLPDFLVNAGKSGEYCKGAARWQPTWTTWDAEKTNEWFMQMSVLPPDFEEEEPELKGPILCCWYSGGLTKEKGRDQLSGLTAAAKKAGIEPLVLDFPDSYGIEGDGSSKRWAEYVNRLVEEIDKEPSRKGRPLFLFGHSRGCTPALTVAAKLKTRVLKMFLLASGAPKKGVPSPFQFLAEGFKKGTDMDLLKWFAGLNPSPVLHRTIQAVEQGDIKLSDSKYLMDMLDTMKKQYVNTIWPDMNTDMEGITCPITAVSPRKDPDAQPPACWGYKELTSGRCDVKVVDAGHMDVVNHHKELIADMVGLAKQ